MKLRIEARKETGVRPLMSLLTAMLFVTSPAAAETCFPEATWVEKTPAEAGMHTELLDRLAEQLGGRGCVVKDGYVIKTWGDQSESSDWYSSAKPVLSTLLFFALQEGRIEGVDQPVADFGWDLRPKDRGITFRHLGAMTSGYARPESAGEAWAYNDFAIQLYQKTLFDKVFQGDPKAIAEDPARLGALGLEDGFTFTERRRLIGSVRDFARIAWFWLNKGRWGEKQVLPRAYFDEYMRPQVSKTLPRTAPAETDDYLGIGSYGGKSDQGDYDGPGVYGFNWWFNDTGGSHPDTRTWPDAPADTVMSLGAFGNSSAFIPSLNVVLVCAQGNWSGQRTNEALRLLTQACRNVAPRLYVIGDSTAAAYPPARHPLTGWAQVLQEYFDERKLVVEDRAQSGRSAKSFADEGAWKEIAANLQPGDYVLIQFGHNDPKKDDPARYTDPNTTYKQYLKGYVDDTRAKGATPILLTSINRSVWTDAGTLKDTMGEYPAAVRALAKELGVPLVDLHAATKELFERLGREKTEGLFMNLPKGASPNYPDGLSDNTHLQEPGARAVCKLAVDALARLDLPLKAALLPRHD